MRAFATALVVSALASFALPLALRAQDARALGSPWEPGRGPAEPSASIEPPEDIHAEDETPPAGSSGTPATSPGGAIAPGSGTTGATPGATGATVAPSGVVVPDGYALPAVPTPGVYPGSGPRIVVDDPLHLSAGIVTRLRALDSDLQLLGARGGGSIVDSVLAFALGGVAIGVGIAFDESVTGVPNSISPYLYLLGSGYILRGVLSLALMTDPGSSATTYTHMPMRTHREVRERLLYGEAQLAHLADMASIARYLDGALNIALGLAIIPVYFAPNGFDAEDAFMYLVLAGAAVSVATGLIALFTTSDAERRWAAYSQLRDRLSATTDGADDDADLEELAEGDAELAAGPAPAGPSLTGRVGIGGLSVDGTF